MELNLILICLIIILNMPIVCFLALQHICGCVYAYLYIVLCVYVLHVLCYESYVLYASSCMLLRVLPHLMIGSNKNKPVVKHKLPQIIH